MPDPLRFRLQVPGAPKSAAEPIATLREHKGKSSAGPDEGPFGLALATERQGTAYGGDAG
jgi:hypothetical protein